MSQYIALDIFIFDSLIISKTYLNLVLVFITKIYKGSSGYNFPYSNIFQHALNLIRR